MLQSRNTYKKVKKQKTKPRMNILFLLCVAILFAENQKNVQTYLVC